MTNIILASESKYKKELLEKLKVPFSVCKPDFEEDEFKTTLIRKDLSELFAFKKADSIANKDQSSIIIGCDQVIYVNQKRLDKPLHREKAYEQLSLLQGQTHELFTSYCLLHKGKKILNTVTAKLKMRPLTQTEIKNYITSDKPLDCAGSYKLESLGITLMEHIETDDFTTITGLPLISLSKNLRELGVIFY